VFPEYYVRFKGVKLFFDFYISELNLFVECQGIQHCKFIKYFHGTRDSFIGQKFRDNLKIEYVQTNKMYLIRLYDTEEINSNLILDKIEKAFDSKYNFCD